MFIRVEPRVKLKLSDLGVDKRTLQSFNPSEPFKWGLKGYRSGDGLVVSLFSDRILQVVYLAGESDKNRCTTYYQDPESFVEVPTHHVGFIYSVDGPSKVKAGEQIQDHRELKHERDPRFYMDRNRRKNHCRPIHQASHR